MHIHRSFPNADDFGSHFVNVSKITQDLLPLVACSTNQVGAPVAQEPAYSIKYVAALSPKKDLLLVRASLQGIEPKLTKETVRRAGVSIRDGGEAAEFLKGDETLEDIVVALEFFIHAGREVGVHYSAIGRFTLLVDCSEGGRNISEIGWDPAT
jgi:hypothetical protein